MSSRPLAYTVRDSLNKTVALGAQLDFALYLDTDKPLYNYQHLVCSCQSLWRANLESKRKPYDLIIVDELTSVIEDFTNVTSKHPKANQDAFQWFSANCTKWIGLDAHLTDTSLVLAEAYFGHDVRVLINHSRGERKDAVFIPRPQWSNLGKVRAKACVPNARPSDVAAFSDATVLYDLMFQCWTMSNSEIGWKTIISDAVSRGWRLCGTAFQTTSPLWSRIFALPTPSSRSFRDVNSNTLGFTKTTVELERISKLSTGGAISTTFSTPLKYAKASTSTPPKHTTESASVILRRIRLYRVGYCNKKDESENTQTTQSESTLRCSLR